MADSMDRMLKRQKWRELQLEMHADEVDIGLLETILPSPHCSTLKPKRKWETAVFVARTLIRFFAGLQEKKNQKCIALFWKF